MMFNRRLLTLAHKLDRLEGRRLVVNARIAKEGDGLPLRAGENVAHRWEFPVSAAAGPDDVQVLSKR